MQLDLSAVARNVGRAETEDLLDRITVYRREMEMAAVELIAAELRRRGVSADAVAEHARGRAEVVLIRPDGAVERCNFCDRPAIARSRDWHRLWRRLPVFPRTVAHCAEHTPGG